MDAKVTIDYVSAGYGELRVMITESKLVTHAGTLEKVTNDDLYVADEALQMWCREHAKDVEGPGYDGSWIGEKQSLGQWKSTIAHLAGAENREVLNG